MKISVHSGNKYAKKLASGMIRNNIDIDSIVSKMVPKKKESKYTRHQGNKETERRIKRMNKG